MWKPGIIILLIQGLTVSVQAQIQDVYPPITIESAAIRVESVLDQITEQTGVSFTYNPRSIDVDRVIAFSVREASLESALLTLSEQTPIRYRMISGQIVLTLPPEVGREAELLTLGGFIEDQSSGESLIGATAAIPGTSRGAVTNAFGFYSLPVQRGESRLSYSYIGYEPKELKLVLEKDQRQNVSLQPRSIDLPDVVVELPKLDLLQERDLGRIEMDPNRLNNMPEFGGESGLVKGLQSLPGIKMHSDGSAFFYTRGGERDQNLIIVDDAPIYNPSHLFGFYSIIVPDFAKSIRVYKSDIPANLGDRLSSIIDIRTRDGNLNKLVFSGALNPLINRFTLEAPLVKKRSSIFVSWRRTNFEWLYERAAPNADLGFGDFNFKWNHRLNENNRLYLTAITSLDNFTNADQAGIRWGNLAATLRWNHIFNSSLFANTTLYTGNYAYRLFSEPNYWQSALGTLSLKSDFTKYNSAAVTTRFGLELQAYFIDPGSASVDPSIAILPEIKPNYSRKSVLYYQGAFELSEKVQFKAGARLVNWANSGPATYYTFDEQYQVTDTTAAGDEIYNRYFRLDPRLSLRYRIDSSAQLKLSAGRYHQYLQLISNSTSPFNSFEVWLPAGPNIRPQSVLQLALNYSKYFSQAQLEFSTALYYKKFDDQIDYEPHATTLLNPLVEGALRFGSMRSYGLELMLKKEVGRLSGWLNYTYSRSMRKTPALNDGRNYPAFQDRPHELSLLLNYRISPRVLFSAYYTAYSGSTFSSPTGFYTYNEQTVPVYGEKNNDRLPTYRRLDLAFKFRLNKDAGRRFQHHLTFSIYNAGAHKNIVTVNFNKFGVEEGRPLVKTDLLSKVPLSPSQTDLIRFFPSLTYQFKL